MLQLRYEKRGEVYVPQYDTGSGWADFKYDSNSNTTLDNVAEALGKLQHPSGSYYHKDSKRTDFNSIYFLKQIYVAAYLGAVWSWYTNITYEFEADIKIEKS